MEMTIGRITKTIGLKGELKVLPFTTEKVLRAQKVVNVNGKPYDVTEWSFRPNGVFLKLNGINTIDQGNSLKDCEIMVPKVSASKALAKDEYFWGDALGCGIIVDGQEIGVVETIDNMGSADIYTVRTKSKKELTFPNVKGLILSMDLENRQIALDAKRLKEVGFIQGEGDED